MVVRDGHPGGPDVAREDRSTWLYGNLPSSLTGLAVMERVNHDREELREVARALVTALAGR